ncbi:flagellar biosynthesis protein FlhF [Clostridium sp.]|uniref:flagellar biosynthesis protein FlhF n=1 Tax=Clostridium sp. TaxID=1506 RepID=UPI002630A6F6|nr:flagellar biosynthesis protein FlhF [Clostridium sp.]
MIIKKYLVKNMNEALTRIRYEMGKDSIIISQRKVKAPGIKGYFKPKLIEVTAALENSKIEEPKKDILYKNENKINNESIDFKNSLDNIKKIIEENNKVDKVIEKPKLDNNSSLVKENEEIKNEVKEIKDLLNKVIKNTNKEDEDEIYNYINDIDVDEKQVLNLLEKNYEKIEDFKKEFTKILDEYIEINNEDLKGRVVLVGPTGVGKTTTIAKLAGRLALIEKKKVGLITIDTYRIGAVEQLKTYAEIMNIPFKVVITLKEMEIAVEELKDCDVILIDTTGRSSKNAMQLSELRAFTQKVNPDHVMLVISGTTKNRDIKTILEGYKELLYEKLIITKLDETSAYGCIFNIINISRKPIAYITTGQNVPDDIKVPSKEEIKRLILGEENIC